MKANSISCRDDVIETGISFFSNKWKLEKKIQNKIVFRHWTKQHRNKISDRRDGTGQPCNFPEFLAGRTFHTALRGGRAQKLMAVWPILGQKNLEDLILPDFQTECEAAAVNRVMLVQGYVSGSLELNTVQQQTKTQMFNYFWERMMSLFLKNTFFGYKVLMNFSFIWAL